jgi:hypothetical protein
MKINLDIVNDVTFYYEMICIVGYTKITKSDKICSFGIHILRSTCLSFLCSKEYKVFEHNFWTFVG